MGPIAIAHAAYMARTGNTFLKVCIYLLRVQYLVSASLFFSAW